PRPWSEARQPERNEHWREILHPLVRPGFRHFHRRIRQRAILAAVDAEEEAVVGVDRSGPHERGLQAAAVRLRSAAVAEVEGDVEAGRIALLDPFVEEAGERLHRLFPRLDY